MTKINIKKICPDMKALSQFVCWKEVPNSDPDKKPKKMPIDPKTGKSASVNDADTWSTIEDAISLFNKKSWIKGIGFVFTKDDPYVGIDLDNCRNAKTGKIESWAQEIIDSFGSYTEVSPNCTGVHIIIKGKLPGDGKKVGNIEIYDNVRFFTLTGNLTSKSNKIIRGNKQKRIDKLYSRITSPTTKKINSGKVAANTNNNDDSKIITQLAQSGIGKKFSKLIHGDSSEYRSQSEADLALCSFLSKETDSPATIDRIFRSSGLMRPKWAEKHGNQTYGEMTIAKALNNPNKSFGENVTKDTPQYEVALEVIKQIGRENFFFHGKQFWKWYQKSGLWKEVADEGIKKRIHRLAHQSNLTQANVTSILGLIKTEVHSSRFKYNKANKRIINCKNGELHYADGIWGLMPFNRDNYFIHQIPSKYDEAADCKKFMLFLDQIFAPDPDKKQKIRLLQEFMGYALIRSCEYERFLLLVGGGANGKSVILVVLTALLGEENVAGVQPNQFEDKFTMAHLQGKLANIITEIPQGAVLADAKLKSLVSGERITAQHKYGKLFDFEPYATLIFAANHLPHTKDVSSAFFRRAEILTFNVDFKGKKADKKLKKELPKEASGVLNFALAGLKRLFDTGEFTKVQCSIDAKKEWERAADQVVAFVEEECTLAPTAKTSVSVLFQRYAAWAEENGIKSAVNSRNLGDRLMRMHCERKKGHNGVRMISGIKLNSE